MCVPFLSLTSECINVTLIYVSKIVLHKPEVRLNWLIEEAFVSSHGRGVCPATSVAGVPVLAGTIDPEAGTIAPP